MQGIILKGIGGFYYIETQEGIIECKARGIFRKEGLTPLAGDRCDIKLLSNGTGNIERILPRKNEFVRPPIANLDKMFVVFAAAQPQPVPTVVDKLTVIALQKEVRPYIVINKTDLTQESAEEFSKVYQKAGFPVFLVSARSGEGMEKLRQELNGSTAVFAGCSGVGKSSVLNCLLPDRNLKTGQVSDKIGRGRHTTREVELLPSEGGYIADSPGFSSLETEGITAEELQDYFPEFSGLPACRFRGCSHVKEPGCRVKEAVSDGQIARTRYQSYVELYEKCREIKAWMK